MNVPPGTIARSTTPHPQRPPVHKSVSLRHSPQAAHGSKPSHHVQPTALDSPNAPASDKANPPSSLSAKTTVNKQSSGESSDAGQWFETINNKAVQRNAPSVENDPPFFLLNSSSSGTPPDGQESRYADFRSPSTSMPYRTGMIGLGADGTSTEDFRSVIDDLTVANKRLKQKLKKYEKLYDAHLQDEKLFEVKFHGLPDHKKKELEETLRKFADELDGPLSDHPPVLSYAPPLEPQLAASSTSRFAESGYASASGPNSNSAPSGQDSGSRKMSKSQYNRQQQSIQSYLHDIPAGLMPKTNAPMTDKSRKKLVVRRLEQIFAGKRSVSGTHHQQLQQEEVAQSAAMADRRAKEATGRRFQEEGLREARFIPVRSEDEDIIGDVPQEALQKMRPRLGVSQQDFAGSGSPNQRPTRPLDLDPYRAQVPAENMDYIRHLGFTPPDMESAESPEDDHGWIYLNLLINMAQLHTINVTPDFVKDALSEYSSKFELSHDGRKIRWKGNQDLTKNSDSSSEQTGGASPYHARIDSSFRPPAKRMKSSYNGDSTESMVDSEGQARRAARAAREKNKKQFSYTPLFYHEHQSDEENDFYNFDMASSSKTQYLAQQRGDLSGLGSSAMRSLSSRKRRDDGPIIFYNKAKFCTDLSGDRQGHSIANPASSYKSITSQPLGVAAQPESPLAFVSGIAEPRGPLDATPIALDPKEGGQLTSSEEELGFSLPDILMDSSEGSQSTMEFEASGLGGVQPDDNFAIRVRRSQVRAEPSALHRHRAKKSQLYPQTIQDLLNERQSSKGKEKAQEEPFIKEEILSTSRKDLPSSILPPASFLRFDSASSGDVDSDFESEVSSNPSSSSSSDHSPATALPLLNISPIQFSNDTAKQEEHSSDIASDENEGRSEDEDDSVDFLATARKLDPSTIMVREREYDAALADRMAEDIPAGSSAATAGGGSGFIGPASNLEVPGRWEEEKGVMVSQGRTSLTRAKNLKRARTSDSLAPPLQPGKSQKLN